MSDLKTCVTCIYKRRDICTKQEIPVRIDLVTGKDSRYAKFYLCETLRRFTRNSCGPRGVWWEAIGSKPKESTNDQPNVFERAVRYMLRCGLSNQ